MWETKVQEKNSELESAEGRMRFVKDWAIVLKKGSGTKGSGIKDI